MYITLSNDFLQIVDVDGRNEMLNQLKKCSDGYVVLGDNSEQEKAFYLVKLFSQEGANKCFGIGIISEGHGLKPHLMINHLDKNIFLGFNKEVVVFDCVNKVILKRYETDSLFYSFVSLAKLNSVLIVHELGIIQTTMSGEKVWDYTCDIIHGFRVVNSLVELVFEDNSAIRLSLLNGEKVN